MQRSTLLSAVLASLIAISVATPPIHAQTPLVNPPATIPVLPASSPLPPADDAELARFQGTWQVVEMVDNGRVINADGIRESLPEGGRVEIVENALLFLNPLDGKKRAKTFKINAAVYPQQVTVASRTAQDSWGIYRFDNERLVLCVAPPTQSRPESFSAEPGSNRMLMVLEKTSQVTPQPGATTAAGGNKLVLPPPPTPAGQVASQPAPQPAPQNVAANVLTDQQVAIMLQGTWKMNDGLGLLYITFGPQGVFSSYREVLDTRTFHQVFVQTPVSSGTWNMSQNRLNVHVSASTKPEFANQNIWFNIRSISDRDLIFMDSFGRVGQAVKVR